MQEIREKIEELVKAGTDTWDRATGLVSSTKDRAVGSVADTKNHTTEYIRAKKNYIAGQLNEITDAASSNIDNVRDNVERVQEQLRPTCEFFHLHPVVGSLSVGAAVQAFRVFLMRPTRLRWPLTATALCYAYIKAPAVLVHIKNIRQDVNKRD